MSAGRRAIDDLPTKTPVKREMEVLSLGLSRTATMSMQAALHILGYKAYHCKEVGQLDLPDENHIDCWREAFRAKMYGNGKPYGKEEFDKLLRNYSAVTDVPCACFPEELTQAYPNAKVILSTRDPDKWLASMESAFFKILESEDWRWFRALAALDVELLAPYTDLLRFPLRYWTKDDWQNRDKLRQAMLDHNDNIRKIVPKENLLEWTPKDGWEPICAFLGKPVPNEPFPNINKGDDAANLHKPIAVIRGVILFGKMLKWPAIAAVVGVGSWVYYARRK